ncbi:dioxygenase [Catenulispora yoronensis]|uniref:dioxygenase family protein n=1 Tax=Catenulispora yoronensis TaxID=450799 RepID=UPI0031D884AA
MDSDQAVQDSFAGAADPRLREIMQAVTRHLHALVREVRLTQAEWEQTIGFLTGVGQMCDATRQEFVLLSDVLGVSMLVETLNSHGHGTEATVLGPFHMTTSPPRELGASIDELGVGTPCVVVGTVTGPEGEELAGASVDVWQCSADGFYDVQQPDRQPPGNGRGLFDTDAQGAFWFRTVVPSHYPIPTDGPVGAMLAATGRYPYRPAHIHFIVSAPGHESLTTHMFVADSPYIDSDAVFAVKRSLIRPFVVCDDAESARRYGVDMPFRMARFDIRLG